MSSHLRDKEIQRLIFYAKGLGAKITIRDYAFSDSGEFTNEPVLTININKRVHRTKTELILTLLHELAHLKFYNINGRDISEGWILEDERDKTNSKKVPKKLRKEIADFEIDSLDLMVNIASELNIKIPMWKILVQKELDKWVYLFYYKTGNFPNSKEYDEKRISLQEKYKK